MLRFAPGREVSAGWGGIMRMTLPRKAFTAPSIDDLVARATALTPMLAAQANEAERQRSVPTATMRQVFDAGLLRYFVPTRFGGYELDWGVQVHLGRALAQGCASTSWLACVVGSHTAYVARMSPEAQEDVWGDGPDVLIATGSVSRNVAIAEQADGYTLSGRWSFCSGVDHAAWALVRGSITNDHRQHYFLVPPADFTIEDDWYVSGMSGTGSKSLVIANAFVPRHRTLGLPSLMSPYPPGSKVNTGYVYSYNFRPFAGTALLGPIIGAAEAVRDAHMAMMRQGVGGQSMNDAQAQLRLAESSAELGAAALILDSLVERQQRYAKAHLDMPKPERIALIRDRTYAARLCFNAAERLATSLDLTAVLDDAPVQRHFRDLAAMVQQIGVNWDRNMINCAKAMFDLPTDIPYLNAE